MFYVPTDRSNMYIVHLNLNTHVSVSITHINLIIIKWQQMQMQCATYIVHTTYPFTYVQLSGEWSELIDM